MRESLSITGIFQIVVLFIVLFTGIMALTINNSTSFGVKDEIISAIDFNEGNFIKANHELSDEIVDAMEVNSYRNTGKCESGWSGFDREGRPVTSGKASVCIRCVNVTNGINNGYRNIPVVKDDFINGYYFQVEAFYQLDLPSFSDTFNFSTKGDSKIVYSPTMPELCRNAS